VIVDLQTGVATGVGPGPTGHPGPVSGIGTVIGGSGGPSPTPGVYNLLIGNLAMSNILTGGVGRRNLLVAEGPTGTLNGGDQDDLLIGGFTNTYDTEVGLASWTQIADEWAGTDDYATRVMKLTTPGSGVPLLDATTVTSNGGFNVMNGTGELALIYTNGSDFIAGFDPGSQMIPIC
jgi:hypothetical protein